MVDPKRAQRETDREEDYRDYDKRNIGEGWPYADEDGVPARQNAPYGTSTSNLDEAERVGVEVGERPEIASRGGPSLSPVFEEYAINDDVLEERIMDVLGDNDNFDPALMTVTVHHGVATLSGKVETAHARALAETLTLAVKGIRSCVNKLVMIGVDSHIPPDADV
ncbi:MAG TPA: BON domain-containing protein [Ensifer sp.]|nr:BON domain-containing protein [Ensifer sp.]